MPQHRGTVVWFNSAKGYGFLKYEGGQDVFCHFSGINGEGYKTLKPEDEVEFDVVKGDSGKLQAANVTRIQDVRSKQQSIAADRAEGQAS